MSLVKVPRKQLYEAASACEGQVLALAALFQRIEAKHLELLKKDDDTAFTNDRLVKTEQTVQHLKAEFESLKELEALRRHEVCRLEALLEAERLQTSLLTHRLQQQLAEEKLRNDRLCMLHEDAVSQREDALAELSSVYADMEAMQATLADSAVYVRYLRRKVLELELETSKHAAQSVLSSQQDTSSTGVFSLTTIQAAITSAVNEAFKCDEDERKKRLKQLQLRWHPDKNPVLTEVATEVTKLINEAVKAAEVRSGKV